MGDLEAGAVSWQILDPSRYEVSETMRDVFGALKIFKIEFTTCVNTMSGSSQIAIRFTSKWKMIRVRSTWKRANM